MRTIPLFLIGLIPAVCIISIALGQQFVFPPYDFKTKPSLLHIRSSSSGAWSDDEIIYLHDEGSTSTSNKTESASTVQGKHNAEVKSQSDKVAPPTRSSQKFAETPQNPPSSSLAADRMLTEILTTITRLQKGWGIYLRDFDANDRHAADAQRKLKIAYQKLNGLKSVPIKLRETLSDILERTESSPRSSTTVPETLQDGGAKSMIPSKSLEVLRLVIQQQDRIRTTAEKQMKLNEKESKQIESVVRDVEVRSSQYKHASAAEQKQYAQRVDLLRLQGLRYSKQLHEKLQSLAMQQGRAEGVLLRLSLLSVELRKDVVSRFRCNAPKQRVSRKSFGLGIRSLS